MTETSKRIKRSKKGRWILLLILVVVGLYVGWLFYNTRQAANRVLANIETQPYRRDSLSAFIYGTGTVEPGQTAVLTWSASGIIGEVGVAVGDRVEKGQPLFTIHANDPANLKKARARLLAAHQWRDSPCDPLPLFYGVIE